MSTFTIHTVETAPVASKDILTAVQKKFGFLPNLLGELAAAPAALKAYTTLNELLGQTSLTPVAQQVVLVAASMTNGCHYCVAAHTAGVTMAGLADDQVGALRSGGPLADPKLEALRLFTTAVVEHRGHVSDADLQKFLAAGYEPAQVFEVLLGVTMKTLSNYSNHIAHTPLDTQLQPLTWEPTHA